MPGKITAQGWPEPEASMCHRRPGSARMFLLLGSAAAAVALLAGAAPAAAAAARTGPPDKYFPGVVCASTPGRHPAAGDVFNGQQGVVGRGQEFLMPGQYGQLSSLVYQLDKPVGTPFGDGSSTRPGCQALPVRCSSQPWAPAVSSSRSCSMACGCADTTSSAWRRAGHIGLAGGGPCAAQPVGGAVQARSAWSPWERTRAHLRGPPGYPRAAARRCRR